MARGGWSADTCEMEAHTNSFSRPWHPGSASETGHRFRVVVLYEDLRSAAYAMQACDILEKHAAAATDYLGNIWNFGALEVPEIFDLVLAAASVSDIVIFSASGNNRPPSLLRRWLRAWLHLTEGSDRTLFALYSGDPESRSACWHKWLELELDPSNIGFFSHEMGGRTAPENFSDEPAAPEIRRRGGFLAVSGIDEDLAFDAPLAGG